MPPTDPSTPTQAVEELAALMAMSPAGILGWRASGAIDRANEVFRGWAGGQPISVAELPEALCDLLGVGESAPPGGGVRERSGWVAFEGGRRLHMRARTRRFAGDAGGERWLAVVEDRSVEDERDLARLEMGALMDSAEVGVATFDTAHGWLDGVASAGGPQTRGGGLQRISREVVEPSSLPAYERLQKALRYGERAEVRYAVRHPEAGRRWLLTRVEPGALGEGRAAFSVVTRDITEQELAQRRNDRLLRELQTILDASAAGIGFFRAGLLVRCNRRFESLLGIAAGAADGETLETLVQSAGAPAEVIREAAQTLEARGSFEGELRLPRGGPQQAPWLSLALRRTAREDGHETVAVIADITTLKAQQAEVEEMAREREVMFELSDVGIAYERSGRLGRANQALADLTGYARSELQSMPIERLYESPEAFSQLREQEQRELLRTGASHRERRLKRGDGLTIWVQATQRLVDPGEAAAGIIWSFVDVDERRRAREALLLQADRTRAILDSVLVGIVTAGEGGIEWMNRSARRMFGGELADFVGEPVSMVATPELGHPLRRTDYDRSLADGQSESFECRLLARDAREFWVAGNVVVTGREQQESRQLTFALLDIDRRRKAEMASVQARASLQRIIETAPLAIALFDVPAHRVLQLNQTMAAFAGMPASALEGRPLEAWLDADTAALLAADFDQAMRTAEIVRRELPRDFAQERDGQRPARTVWDVRCISLHATESEADQVLFVASDVTEQRMAEQARLEAAISQREILIREVHHRIKNNLQGVAGLLQQSAQRHPESAAAIGEAVAQVHAIAQVHGLHVGPAGPLRVKGVLEAIAASVQRMFGRTIVVSVRGEAPHRFALAEQDSIAVALSINELLTNAIKHGGGDVRCRLDCEPDRVVVEIASAGRLPEGFSISRLRGGLSGLGLVRALLPRKGSSFEIEAWGEDVVARISLSPPGLQFIEPGEDNPPRHSTDHS